jgi:hypothetical protein
MAEPVSECDRQLRILREACLRVAAESRERLCTKTPELGRVFVQDGFLHKNPVTTGRDAVWTYYCQIVR